MIKRDLIKGSIVIVVLTILSKMLGFFRETLIASNFGATYSTDIYTFAMGFVLLIFTSIGSGLGTTFIPMLTEYIDKKNSKQKNRFVNNILTITFVIVSILVIIGTVFSKYAIRIFAPGFILNPSVFNEAINITRIMFVSLLFIGLQNILTSVLQSHNEFAIPAFMPTLSNFILIFYLFFLSKKFGVYGLAICTVIGYFAQFIIHIPSYRRLGYKYKFTIDLFDKDLKKMIKLMIPVIIGVSVSQINFLVDRLLATTIGEGSISILNFAYKLNTLTYGIFTISITTVIYPSLATFFVQSNMEAFRKFIVKAINIILIIMIPATVGLVLLREPIVTIVFKRGAFDTRAASLTANTLMFYSPTMIFYSISDILNRAFYSIKKTSIPMINSMLGVVINIVLNLLLVKSMGIYGLALATTISSVVTTTLLIYALNKEVGIEFVKVIKKFLIITFASTIMGVFVVFIQGLITYNFGITLKWSIISVGISVLLGILVYIGLLHLFRIDEYSNIIDYIKSYIKKLKICTNCISWVTSKIKTTKMLKTYDKAKEKL